MTVRRQRIGRKGEDAAANYLEGLGYKIIARNYRNPIGEIDLITTQHGRIIFVEVKAKTGVGRGSPEEMVDRRKQQKLARVIKWYVMEAGSEPRCRVDVIALQWKGREPVINHIQDAFELSF